MSSSRKKPIKIDGDVVDEAKAQLKQCDHGSLRSNVTDYLKAVAQNPTEVKAAIQRILYGDQFSFATPSFLSSPKANGDHPSARRGVNAFDKLMNNVNGQSAQSEEPAGDGGW